ncbi:MULTISPECIES: transposase [unclassified Microbacterium]|uniref:transposase n=1 Tax=unclassified Microbacterium TaxID=2609290 RepID=UPI00300FB8C2
MTAHDAAGAEDPRLIEIAVELYTAPPGEFVARRNSLAQEDGERDRAARIRTLRKPSVAAWVVNVFATERADRLATALELAAELREAQEDLDARSLAELGRQRRALTTQLAREAATVATARGERVTESTLEAVRQTIAAAFFDPQAAMAVASGRLVRELEASSGTPIDPASVVGGGAPSVITAAAEAPPADELRARRERKAAEREVREAEQELQRAQRAQDRADRGHAEAESRAERLSARIAELEEELARLRADADETAAAVDAARAERASAAERAAQAQDRLDAARSALPER